MHRIFLLLLPILLAKTWAQSCSEWDSTTYYHPGDRVIFHNNAYEAITDIWYWKPPSYPVSWKQIPYFSCYFPQDTNLKVNVGKGGSVRIEKLPNGTTGTIPPDSSVGYIYPPNSTVTLTALPGTEFKFMYWIKTTPIVSKYLSNPVLHIHTDTQTIVDAYFDTLWRDQVLIQLATLGSVVVNPTIEGTIDTFSGQNGKSILLEFYRGDSTTLTVLPSSGYEFIDWGDESHTTANPYKLHFNGAYYQELTPSYDIASSLFKVPSVCVAGNHMRINGRSRFYGSVTTPAEVNVRGSLNFTGKNASLPYCKVTNTMIDINGGFRTLIDDRSITANRVNADSIQTDTLYVNDMLKADSIIAGRVQVDIAIERFPDFVFTNYHRRSIDELEAYIRQNGKLPEFPSAEEVREKGLDMGRMCTDVLGRIEETTLYLIELNKRIDALEKSAARETNIK